MKRQELENAQWPTLGGCLPDLLPVEATAGSRRGVAVTSKPALIPILLFGARLFSSGAAQ
jgi:hypothetical protein